ncbi:MAG: hypothetical protein ABI721_02945 [Candidatus Dojkabacteria bacterium]
MATTEDELLAELRELKFIDPPIEDTLSPEEQAQQLFEKYLSEGGRSTTQRLPDGTRTIPVEEDEIGEITALRILEIRKEIVFHILHNSYLAIQQGSYVYFSINDTSPEDIIAQENYIRQRMLLVILQHLFIHPQLGPLALKLMKEIYWKSDKQITFEALANSYIDSKLNEDREAARQTPIKNLHREVDNMVLVIRGIE